MASMGNGSTEYLRQHITFKRDEHKKFNKKDKKRNTKLAMYIDKYYIYIYKYTIT